MLVALRVCALPVVVLVTGTVALPKARLLMQERPGSAVVVEVQLAVLERAINFQVDPPDSVAGEVRLAERALVALGVAMLQGQK